MSHPDPELLRVEFVGATLRHDPVALPRHDLALLFATLSQRYDLSRLELQPEGATLVSAEGTELVLRADRCTACAVATLGYQEGRDRVLGLVGEADERFGLSPTIIEDVTLVAVWDCGDEETVRALLEDGMAGVDRERLALLGGDERSLGLRVWRRDGDGSQECAIEPVHAEPHKLYIRMVHTQAEAVPDLAALRAVLDEVRELVLGPVAAFVRAGAARE